MPRVDFLNSDDTNLRSCGLGRPGGVSTVVPTITSNRIAATRTASRTFGRSIPQVTRFPSHGSVTLGDQKSYKGLTAGAEPRWCALIVDP